VTDLTADPFEQAIDWLRAHEFPDAERLAPGSSVIDGTAVRARVWTSSPTPGDLRDLATGTPEGAWSIAVLAQHTDGDLADEATEGVAVFVLDHVHGTIPLSARAHELVEWIGRRQKAHSFAQRAQHALATEGLGAIAPEPQTAAAPDGLPVRGRDAAVSRNAMPTAEVLRTPEPTAEEAVEPAIDEKEAQRLRIEEQRAQRKLRKSFKGR